MQDRINLLEVIPNANESALGNIQPINRIKPSKVLVGQSALFPVKQEKLFLSNGRETDIYAIINAENGHYVGHYGSEDVFISNKELMERLFKALDLLGIDYDVKMKAYGKRADRFHAILTLNEGLKVNGFESKLELHIKNSFGNGALMCQLGLLLLICLNGMVGMQKAFSLLQRHSKSLSLDYVVKELEQRLSNAQNGFQGMFDGINDIQINDNQVATMLGNMARLGKQSFSKKMASYILLNWHNPDEPERGYGDTLWRFLNAGTRVFRDLSDIKGESAHKANEFFLGSVVLALQDKQGIATGFGKGAWDKLNKPLEIESPYCLVKPTRALEIISL